MNLHALGFRLLHNVNTSLQTLHLAQTVANLSALRLEKRISHPATNDDVVGRTQ